MKLGILIIFVLIVLNWHFSFAGSKQENPLFTAKKLYWEVLKTVKNKDLDLRQKTAAEMVDKYFDFDTFSKWVLYDHLPNISAEKLEQFLVLFKVRFTENVVNRLTKPAEKEFKIEYVGRIKKLDFTEIKYNVITNGEKISLALKWVKRDQKWLLADLTIAKANLVANYQGQFNKIIREHGFDELLRRLKSENKF